MTKLDELVKRAADAVDYSFKGDEHVTKEQIAARVDAQVRWLMGTANGALREDLTEAIMAAVAVKPKELKEKK